MSEKILCPRCHEEDAKIHPIYGVLLGRKCRYEDETKRKTTHTAEFLSQTMANRVQQQRDAHERDLLPPYDFDGKPSEEFRRAFPDKAKELYSEYERITGDTTELSQ